MGTPVFLRHGAPAKKSKKLMRHHGQTSSEKTEANPSIDALPPSPPPPSESASLGLPQGVGQEGWSAVHDDDVPQLHMSVSKRAEL